MIRRICLLSLVPFIAAATPPPETCPYAGPTLQWELDHCFIRTGTDDEEHPLIKACLDLAPDLSHASAVINCSRKQKLKTFRCILLRKGESLKERRRNAWSQQNRSAERCPAVVSAAIQSHQQNRIRVQILYVPTRVTSVTYLPSTTFDKDYGDGETLRTFSL